MALHPGAAFFSCGAPENKPVRAEVDSSSRRAMAGPHAHRPP